MLVRVLHLIPSISPLRGGPSQAVLSMAAALRRQSIDASILTTNDHGPGVDTMIPLGRWHFHHGIEGEVPIIAFPRWSTPVRAIREFGISLRLLNWLRANAPSYDLIHVHSLFSFSTSLGMAHFRHAGIPYIVRTIGQLNLWSLGQKSKRKEIFLSLIDRQNLACAKSLHFTSESEFVEASNLGLSTPSFVLPLGVTDLYQSCLSRELSYRRDRPVTFLFLSRLHPKKQLPLLFEALALLKKRHPHKPWILSIAGDGTLDYVRTLKDLCSSLGISQHVHWHGFLQGVDKQNLLQNSDWFVLPSASENFGIAAAEALMAGVPAVLFPGVAISSFVRDSKAGLVCDPSIQSLALHLEQCLDPPAYEMRAAARQLALDHFGWDSIARDLAAHYSSVLNG